MSSSTILASALRFACFGQASKGNKAFLHDLLWKMPHFLLVARNSYSVMAGIFYLETHFWGLDSIFMVDLLCAEHCAWHFNVQEWGYHLRSHMDSRKEAQRRTQCNSQCSKCFTLTSWEGCCSSEGLQSNFSLACGRRIISLPCWWCSWWKDLWSCSSSLGNHLSLDFCFSW